MGLIGTGLTVADPKALECIANAAQPTIRVAAVQMTAELANVEANLSKAERLTRLAFKRGARWVVLPEFFTSGIAFHPDMAKATEAPSRALAILQYGLLACALIGLVGSLAMLASEN